MSGHVTKMTHSKPWSWDLLDDHQKLLSRPLSLSANAEAGDSRGRTNSSGSKHSLCRGHKLHDAAMKEDHLCVNIDHSRGTSSNWCGLNIACHKVALHQYGLYSSLKLQHCFIKVVATSCSSERAWTLFPSASASLCSLSMRVYCGGKIPPELKLPNGCKVGTIECINDYSTDTFCCWYLNFTPNKESSKLLCNVENTDLVGNRWLLFESFRLFSLCATLKRSFIIHHHLHYL